MKKSWKNGDKVILHDDDPEPDTKQIEPDTLPAGPDLNALVAEHVMGWKWFPILSSNKSDGEYRGEMWHGPAINVKKQLVLRRNFGTESNPIPPPGPFMSPPDDYSGDISAAWEIVEKLKDNGLVIKFWIQKDTGGSPENECIIETMDYNGEYDKGSRWFAEAPTAPVAICRAALKAVMV